MYIEFRRIKAIILLIALTLILSTTSFAQRPTIGGEANDFTLVNSAGEVISLSDLEGTPVILNFWATWCVPCREELPFFQTTYDEVNGTSDAHNMSDNTSENMSNDMDEDALEDATEEVITEDEEDSSTSENSDEESNTNANTTETSEIVEEAEEVTKKLHFVIVNNNEDGEKATAFLEEININLTSLIDASKDERKALADAGTELDKTIDVVKNYRVRGMPTTFYIDADGVIQVIKQGLITPQSMQQDLAKIGIDWQPVIEEDSGS